MMVDLNKKQMQRDIERAGMRIGLSMAHALIDAAKAELERVQKNIEMLKQFFETPKSGG